MNAIPPIQDVHAGRQAFARDLERYLDGRCLTELGWESPDALTLLVPMFGTFASGERDLYLLKLVFDYYPKHPPRAKFINPLTRDYDVARDIMWMPRTEGVPDLGFHPNYNQSGQLICSSMTAEFYEVQHHVEPAHVWSPERHSFMSTLAAIRKGLSPVHYRGRASA